MRELSPHMCTTEGRTRIVIMTILVALLMGALSADAAQRRSARLDEARQALKKLLQSPAVDGAAWRALARDLHGIRRRSTNPSERTTALFLVGKTHLEMYKRMRVRADLETAITHLRRFIKLERDRTTRVRGLKTLAAAYALKRGSRSPSQPSPGGSGWRNAADNGGGAAVARIGGSRSEIHPRGHLLEIRSADSPELAPNNRRTVIPRSVGNPFFKPGTGPVFRVPLPERRASLPRPIPSPVPKTAPEPNPQPVGRRFTVVIDPGHGGKDPGAISPDGKLTEKEVTLRIARLVKKLLESGPQPIDVLCTREEDRFLTLKERTSLANAVDADLFISIHCNSTDDNSSSGLETYYLSRACSPAAMRVAARENGISAAKMSDLEAVLLDLMVTAKKAESEALARAIHAETAVRLKSRGVAYRDRGVRRAPFYVLLGAKMPAIIVECGFMSSRRDRALLRNRQFLRSLASGIAAGAQTYLGRSPAPVQTADTKRP